MRYLFFFVMLLAWSAGKGQGSGFSFMYSGPTQILVGPNCEAPLNWGHPNTPTCTSNIPGGVIVSFDIYSISLGYEIGDLVPGGTTVTIFYQAVDNFGNNALFGFTISFIDVLPPIFDPQSLPSNITVSCTTTVPPPANVEATDNCEGENTNLTITFTETNNAVLCTGGSIIRKWVADDDLGNTATFIQNITVTPDNTPPVINNNLQNGMAPCSTAMAQYSSWLNAQRAAFMATDNGCGIMSLTDNAPNPAIITSFCGAIDVTFTAKDNCNNISTVIKTFTVFNNVAPVITTPATGSSGNCSQNNIAQLFNTWINTHGGATATDDCSSIFWSTFPPSPSIHDTCDAAINVMFIAGDGCGNFDTTSASFILTDDTAPVITVDPSTVVLSCSTTAIDSILMDWLVKGGNSDAHDLCTDDNDLILGYRIGGTSLTLAEVLDAWQDSLASGCRDNVLIGGLGLDNVKAHLPVQFTYTDKCGNEGGKIGHFGITDNGRPIFETMPVDTAFGCSENGNWEDAFLAWYNSAGASTYSDLCSEVTVNASITADSALQYLSAALDTACLQGVEVTIQFNLTDECGNSSLASPSASFSVQDTIAPMLVTAATDVTMPCSENAQLQLQMWIDTLGGAEASDGCGDLNWEFSWVDTSGMVQTGILGTGPYPELSSLDCEGGVAVIFTGFDICQNSVSDTAVFAVIDTLPPVILIPEDSIHLACQDTIPADLPVVVDGCDVNVLVTYTDSVSADSCLGLPELMIRTWTATDACGNFASAQQWYFRLDTIAPTFDLPSDTVAFCSIDTLTLLNVTDNCDPSPFITWNDALSGLACGQTLTRIWMVSDACGNTSTAQQQFDLSDDAPPEIIYSPGHYVYTCDSALPDLQTSYEQWKDSVIIEDGCSEAFYFIALRGSYVLGDTSSWPGSPVPDSIMVMCGIDMAIEADLVAYDECENVLVEEISFAVNDTVSPIFINCPGVLIVEPDTVDCNALVTLTSPDYDEVCFEENVIIELVINDGDTILLDSTLTIDTLLPVGIHSALWLATDCNGNIGTCLTSIEIIDEGALNVFCPADTLLFSTIESCQVSVEIYPPKTTTSSCGKGVITWSGYIEGAASPSAFVFDSAIDTVLVDFTSGLHQVFLIAQDTTGDRDTCFYTLDVRDTFPPDIICQDDAVFLSPSGLENIDVSTTSLLISSNDACGIDTVRYDPPFVNCSNNGQSVPITITVVDENGNSSTCQSILEVNTLPLMPLWESQLCDDTLRLFANLPGEPDTIYTFTWSGPNSFSSMEENPVIPDSDTSDTGLYILTVQSDNGCISMGSVEIVVEELTAPNVTVSADTVCTGSEVVLSTQSFSGDVNYQWYHVVTSGDTIIGNTVEPQLAYTPSQPGTYSVYAIVSQDTCVSEPGIPVDFEVVPVPEAALPESAMILCIDDTLFLAPAIIFDSLQYVWTGSDGYTSDLPAPPGIPASDIDSTVTYFLTVSNDFCASLPDSLNVTVQLPPTTPIISGDTLVCEGGSFILTTQSVQQSYEWIDPSGNSIFTNADTLFIISAELSQSGGWMLIVSENGCPSDTSIRYQVTVDTAIQVDIISETPVCEGASIQLSLNPLIPGAYVWTGPGGFTSTETSPTTLALNGTYFAFITSTTGCEAQDSIDVTVDQLPVITTLVTDADSCSNGIDALRIWAETSPHFSDNFTYTWDGPSAFLVQDSSLVIDSATALDNGLYTLFITNGTCISDLASITLELKDSPTPPVISGDNVYCYGDSVLLSIANPVTGGMYAWTSSDTNVVINSPGTLIIPDATQAWTGVYTVDVTLDGCTSASSIIAVQVKAPLFAPSILSPSLVCEGDSLILIANGPPGVSFQWISSNGFESTVDRPVIYPVGSQDAGTYQVLYILNGCPSPPSNPYEINVQPALNAPSITADLTSVCIDNPVPIQLCIDQASLVPGGTYTWLLNGTTVIGIPGPDSCITIDGNPLQGGVNEIAAVVSLQGCPSATGNAVLITGDEIPAQGANAGVDITVCPGDVIILDASVPLKGTGVWTSGDDLVILSDASDPNANIIGLPSGVYGLAWTLSYASCMDYSQDSMHVEVLFTPETLPDTFDVPFGQTLEFAVTLNDNISMGPYTVEIVMGTQKGNVLHVGNGVFRYSPNVGFVGTDMMIYRICSSDCPDECSESLVILKVGNEDDCFVPSLFTPNEDGVNDILIVPCLETDRYPDNKIIIFNEWGAAVYTASPYQNDWDGSISGSPLPVGTYFYIMDFGDGSTPKRSFLILER